MWLSFASGKTLSLTAKLTAAATTLTADIDVWVTAWRLYLKNDEQEEWIDFTWVSANWSYFDYTWLTRGLSQTADGVSAWTWKTWLASNKWALVQMHDQAFNRQKPKPITFATTAARDTALWADWAATEPYINVYVTATWLHYNYNLSTNQWESVDTWTTTPNASETAAGKVELPTDAQVTAKTATWETWAALTPTNAQIGKSVALKAVDATLDDTDHLVFDNAGTDNKMLVSVFRDQLAWDKTKKGTFEMLTDAEAITWTDETRVPNWKQMKDNYLLVTDTIILTRVNTVATWTVQYAHWLWRIPKLITFHCIDATNQWSNWAYDWTTNNCAYATWTPWANASSTVSIRTNSSSWSAYQTWAVSAMTTTTFDIDRTKVWSPTNTSVVHATLIA